MPECFNWWWGETILGLETILSTSICCGLRICFVLVCFQCWLVMAQNLYQDELPGHHRIYGATPYISKGKQTHGFPVFRCSLQAISSNPMSSVTHRIHVLYIYANIWGILMVNVTIYGIHGSYGLGETRGVPSCDPTAMIPEVPSCRERCFQQTQGGDNSELYDWSARVSFGVFSCSVVVS